MRLSSVQKQKKAQDAKPQESVETSSPAAQETDAALDELMGEIDSVLEENAAEFVAGYVQKGGQ